MLLHVGKLKKPSRQFCQQFTEMYLISEVELSPACNLILLNYHSKMPKCLVFRHGVEGLPLILSRCQLMREETSEKYAGVLLSPPAPLNMVVLMSTPEQNITFHCRSKTSPWIISFSNLRSKGCMLTATSFISLSINERHHWYKGQPQQGVQFSESICSISLMWTELFIVRCYLWTAVSDIVFYKWQNGTRDYLFFFCCIFIAFLHYSEVSCIGGRERTGYKSCCVIKSCTWNLYNLISQCQPAQ